MGFLSRFIFRFILRYAKMAVAALVVSTAVDKDRRDEIRYWADYQKTRLENYIEEAISGKLGKK